MGQGRPRVEHQWRPTSGKGIPATARGVLFIPGITEWGPEWATMCTSWTQWNARYGYCLVSYETAVQVKKFFDEATRANRTGRVWTKRLFHYADHTVVGATPASALKGTRMLKTGAGPYGVQNTLKVDGKFYGALALTVQVLAATNGDASCFDLLVYHPRQASPIRRYRNLTMDSTAQRYAPTVVNTVEESQDDGFITVTDQFASGTPTQRRPVNDSSAVALTGGNNGLASLGDDDFLGGSASMTGLHGFDAITYEGSILIVPDNRGSSFQDDATSWCEVTKGGKVRFLPEAAVSSALSTAKAKASALASSIYRAGILWPHVQVANPDKTVYGQGRTITIGPSGGIAGRISFLANDGKNGDTRGPFISPSNEDFGWIESFVGLEGTGNHEVLNPSVQDEAASAGINCILTGRRALDGRTGVWLQNCLIGDQTETDVQSMGNMFGIGHLQQSYENLLQRHLTQDNSEERRRTVKEQIEADLRVWTGRGCFSTREAKNAFVVDVDPEGIGINNPQVQLQKEVYIIIGFALSSPGMWWYLVFTKDDRAVQSFLLKGGK